MTGPTSTQHVADHLLDGACPACLLTQCRNALAESDKVARAATQGPWSVRIEGGRDYTDEYWSEIMVDFTRDDKLGTGPGTVLGDHEEAVADAVHIAANDPFIRLALNQALRVVLFGEDGKGGLDARLGRHTMEPGRHGGYKWCPGCQRAVYVGDGCVERIDALASLAAVAQCLDVSTPPEAVSPADGDPGRHDGDPL